MLEGQIDSSAAQESLDALNDEYPDDLIDDLCLILDKSIKRVSSLSPFFVQTLIFLVAVGSIDLHDAQRVCCTQFYN